MDWTPAQKTNSSYLNPQNDVGLFTCASFNPSNFSAFHLMYLKTLQEDQDFEKLKVQQDQDQKFMAHYILKGKKIGKTFTNMDLPMKIFQAKNIMSEVICLKKHLECLKNQLNINDDNFEVKLSLAKEIEINIHDHLSKFNPIVINSVQVALHQRIKKRKDIFERRYRHFDFKKKVAKVILKKHNIIDKLLNKTAKEVNSIKVKENLKRQADSVLHEVRGKKFESKKILSTLNAISKLREVKSQEVLARGGYCSKPLTDMFNSVTKHFQETWKSQLELYHLEEKGLKVMLEVNPAQELSFTKSKYQAIFHQWEQAIFGDHTPCRNDFFISSKNYEESLIRIRRKWDEYLVDSPTVMSSGIPSGWALPPYTKDENWLKLAREKSLHRQHIKLLISSFEGKKIYKGRNYYFE